MIAIIDYGVGNLFSLKSSFAMIGEEVTVTRDAEEIRQSDRILLPGVGAFEDAARKLRDLQLDKLLVEEAQKGKPLMGICLGMQLLFEKSYEYGEHQGLGLLKGSVRPLKGYVPPSLKIPHMGWNALHLEGAPHPLFSGIREGDCVYFVHSYAAMDCESSLIASCEYGAKVTAAVARGNVMGCQFHPEKSGQVGLSILRAFCQMKGGYGC